jgi:hypothetical protein
MSVPHVSDAIVTAQSPPYSVFVSLIGAMGGQGPTLPVQVLTHSARDAVRGTFPPLPTVGTTGTVLFSRGDSRNGRWVGAIDPALPSAAAHTPGSGSISYEAHWSGGWTRRAQNGTLEDMYPDGTHLSVGPPQALPGRYVVDGGGFQKYVPFSQSDRVAKTPTPFPISIVQPTGATVNLTASGSWAMHAANGQANTFTASQSTITQDASGGITVNAASGQPITITANSATVQIDGSGNVSIISTATITVSATTGVNLHAPTIFAGNGGVVQPVQLADNSLSTIFRAQ